MILLATDLDGTLVGDSGATQKLLETLQPLRQQQKLELVYATGRSLERYKASQSEEQLPDPDAIICAVGTEIYIGSTYDRVVAWEDTFSNGWDRKAIYGFCKQQAALHDQPSSEQRPYKISFDRKTEKADDLTELKSKLAEVYPVAEMLVSHAGEFVDIVPRNSDKGSALNFLAEQWQILDTQIITAGDSLNDATMLDGTKAIIVGNAYDELRKYMHQNPETFLAHEPFANGILEGLNHYLGENWSEQ